MSQSAHGLQDITLNPGVNTQLTLEANQAGISVSQALRYKTGLPQKLGGWTQFYPSPVSSTPVRDVHAFQGFGGQKFVGIGSVTRLAVISCGVLQDITPQVTVVPNSLIDISATSGSNIITVTDLSLTGGVAPGGSVYLGGNYFSIGGGVPVSSAYNIIAVLSSIKYQIALDVPAVVSLSTAPMGINSSTPPYFMLMSVSSGSFIATVTFPSAAFSVGSFYNFTDLYNVISSATQPNTTLQVTSIIDSTSFTVNIGQQAAGTGVGSGFIGITYFQAQQPTLPPLGYGSANYSSGAFGVGVPALSVQGTPITAADWSLDNAGNFLVAIPQNGPVYYWAPEVGYTTALVVANANSPMVNRGGFISQPQQILMLFGATNLNGVQDPLLVRWSDSASLTLWIPSPQTFSGSFRVPTGSLLIGGLQAPLYAVVWTDVDVWTATWVGQPLIWAWLRAGTGCGLIGQHAADVQQGVVYWCGPTNFYQLGSAGVTPLPCSVWDFIFDNIDKTNQTKVRAASNSYFNEISWFFPLSQAACTQFGLTYTGENNAYVKLHIGEGNEYEWDYGLLGRTAWVDTTALGAPIGVDGMGNLLQHETSFDAAGVPINAYLETGYFTIGDGSDLAIVDYVLPDIKWNAGTQTAAGTLLFTFYTTDYPSPQTNFSGGARTGERIYGPFQVTQATQFINTRMRGRFWRCRIESNDLGTFWRIGKIKFRWGASGRR